MDSLNNNKKTPIAVFCYDFDGTLIPGNMQEYGLIQNLGFPNVYDFWNNVAVLTKESGCEAVLSYMKYMADVAKIANVSLDKDNLRSFGSNMPYFNGVKDWFDAINQYALSKDVKTEHYIISSGLTEVLKGTSIAKSFSGIYASSYLYENGIPIWPSRVVNYTGKTQYLYRISKGALNLSNDIKVNSIVPAERRRVPLSNMVYIGDGETDIPCMQVIKDAGGLSIAVYDPNNKKKHNIADKLKTDGRVHCSLPADYSEDKELFSTTIKMIDKVALERDSIEIECDDICR